MTTNFGPHLYAIAADLGIPLEDVLEVTMSVEDGVIVVGYLLDGEEVSESRDAVYVP